MEELNQLVFELDLDWLATARAHEESIRAKPIMALCNTTEIAKLRRLYRVALDKLDSSYASELHLLSEFEKLNNAKAQ